MIDFVTQGRWFDPWAKCYFPWQLTLSLMDIFLSPLIQKYGNSNWSLPEKLLITWKLVRWINRRNMTKICVEIGNRRKTPNKKFSFIISQKTAVSGFIHNCWTFINYVQFNKFNLILAPSIHFVSSH